MEYLKNIEVSIPRLKAKEKKRKAKKAKKMFKREMSSKESELQKAMAEFDRIQREEEKGKNSVLKI